METDLIGEGSYSHIYKGNHLEEKDVKVAVKVINILSNLNYDVSEKENRSRQVEYRRKCYSREVEALEKSKSDLILKVIYCEVMEKN